MSGKLIKKLFTLVLILLLPVVVAAAAYGFIWWKVTGAADDFAKEISPFAEMRYQKVHIDLLNSEVGLGQMTLTPVGMEGDVGLDSIVLRAPSWKFLLDLEEQVNKGNLPESFHLDLKGLNVDLQSGYMQDWARMVEDMQKQVGPGYDTLACGGLQYFSLSDVRKMGYSQMSMDISLLYDFDKQDRQLNFDIDASNKNMLEMSMSMEVQVASDSLNVQTMVFAQPQLKRVEMRFSDKGYNFNRNKYCAELNQHEVADYRAQYLEELKQRLASEGWVIPDHILTAFDGLNNPGGSMLLRVDMPQGFGPQTMMMVQTPTDLIDLLSPYVEFNAQPILLDGISWEAPDPEAEMLRKKLQQDGSVIEDIVSEEAEEPVAEEPAVVKPKRSKSKRSKKLEKLVLANHLGSHVELYTYFGRRVEGKLVSVTDDTVTIEHRLERGRGTATYPIAKDKIETVRLLH